jgi:hypothetical protein
MREDHAKVWEDSYNEIFGNIVEKPNPTPNSYLPLEYFQPEGLSLSLLPSSSQENIPSTTYSQPSYSSAPTQMASHPPPSSSSTQSNADWSFLIQQISELRESNRTLESRLQGVTNELSDLKLKKRLATTPSSLNSTYSTNQSMNMSSQSQLLTGWHSFAPQPELAVSVWKAAPVEVEGGCTRNEKFVEMLGYPIETLKNNFTCSKLVRKQDLCPEFREKGTSGRDWPRKTQIITAFGLRDVWITISPVHTHNNVIKYYIVHLMDYHS